MKWFQHQSKANTDAKLQKLLIKFGFEGYGLYWYCVESIVNNMEPKLTFELEPDSEILAHVGRMDSARVEDCMRYMVTLGLFTEASGVIYCRKILNYLGDSLTRNPALKEMIKESKKAIRSETVSDSMRLSQGQERTGEERRGNKPKTYTSSSSKSDPVPFTEIINLYHEKLPQLPAVQKLTAARKAAIRQRWKSGDLPALENWSNFFDYIAQSDFLMGRAPPGPNRNRPFLANLEWVTKEANYTKILEGAYHGV